MKLVHRTNAHFSDINKLRGKIMAINKGTIYLVGAGPGNPDYLTVKALEVLENADVVMHDNVVSQEILSIAKKAKLIDVGLAGYANISHQKEIATQLVSFVDKDKVVCRLKSGDPFLFGNGGETVNFIIEACKSRHEEIQVEIVPGISSGLGATASLGIPLTHTGVKNSVCIISGHQEENISKHDYMALSSMGTLVLYMSLRSLKEHVGGLLASGMKKDVPVCIIEKGCHADQRVIKTELDNLLKIVIENKIQEPVIFVIGNTIKYSAFI